LRLRLEDKTRAEVGLAIGIPEERVRQLEQDLMKKLKAWALELV